MKYLTCCLLLSFFLACTEKTEKPVLSDEKLARIMADLNIAEAATIGLAGYPKDSMVQVYIAQVFEMHGTTLEAYENDLRIVGTDLPRLKAIVDASIALLDGKQQ
jgi:Domain of unknown function (DUF4296)